jgi:alpha-L-glutamate ligase-like protein
VSAPRDRRRDVLGINRRNLDLVFAGYRPGRFRDLDDKILAKTRLESAGVAVPTTIGLVRDGRDLADLEHWLADHDQLVIKPARGSGGRGILVLARGDAGAWTTPGGRRLGLEAIRQHVLEILSGAHSLDESQDQALVEERIFPHEFLEELYPHGLSDLRVVIEDGEPVQAMLRVPTDASDGKANLHGGGLGLGIDIDTGTIIHAIQRDQQRHEHPDTGTPLVGRQVPRWDACLAVARAAAKAVPHIRYLGVDIVIDARRGPLVLEINARPGLAIQIANGRGQPVQRRTRLSLFDRLTQHLTWAVLALLAVAPWLVEAWQLDPVAEVQAVRDERWRDLGAPDPADNLTTVEWAESATTVSALSARFAAAREAAAAGDTAQAVALYQEAATDSTLTPFALNNLALIQRSRGDLDGARDHLEQAVAAFPAYARGHYNLGLVLRDLDRPAQAEAAFGASLDLRPGHARSWSELAMLQLARGEADSARLALEQAVRFDPDAVRERRRLARVHRTLDQPGAAAMWYEQALALSPDDERSALGWVDARLGHAAATGRGLETATLDSLHAVLTPHLEGRASVGAHTLAAELDWWAGQPLAAIDLLRGVPLERMDTRALTTRAVLALELGLWDEAEACLRASASNRLDRVAQALVLGRALDPASNGPRPRDLSVADPVIALAWRLARNDTLGIESVAPDQALDDTEAAFLSNLASDDPDWSALAVPTPARLRRSADLGRTPVPGSLLLAAARHRPDAASTLARTFPSFLPHLANAFQADLATAAAQPDRAGLARDRGLRLLRLTPGDPDVLIALAGLELDLDAAPAARQLFEQLDVAHRGRPDARRMEARIWLAEGDARAARRRLAQLAKASPLDPQAWALLAAAEAGDGRDRAAANAWQQVLQLTPGDRDAREQLARTLMSLRDHAAAATHWQQLLQSDLPPDRARSARFNLALALQRDGQLATALSTWDALLADAPDSRPAAFNRALALERLGRLDAARAAFTRVLEIDPDHEPSLRHLQELQGDTAP